MSLSRLVLLRNVKALLAKTNALNPRRGFASSACLPALKQTQQESLPSWGLYGAACAAAVGLASWLYEYEGHTRCLQGPTDPQEDVPKVSTAHLQHWLHSVGASIDAVEVRASQEVRLLYRHMLLVHLLKLQLLQRPEAGLGLFASDGIWKPLHVSWWKRPWYSWQKPNEGIILASFPLQAAMTPKTILSDPVLGPSYQELLSIGKKYLSL